MKDHIQSVLTTGVTKAVMYHPYSITTTCGYRGSYVFEHCKGDIGSPKIRYSIAVL